eukprot:2420019-Amphidinium_carterae.1
MSGGDWRERMFQGFGHTLVGRLFQDLIPINVPSLRFVCVSSGANVIIEGFTCHGPELTQLRYSSAIYLQC